MEIECFKCHGLVDEEEQIAGCCFKCYYGSDYEPLMTYGELEQKLEERESEIKKYHQMLAEYQSENYKLFNMVLALKDQIRNLSSTNQLDNIFANMVIIKPEDMEVDIPPEKKYNTTRKENVIYFDFNRDDEK